MRIYVIAAAAGLMLAPISASACEVDLSAIEALHASAQAIEQPVLASVTQPVADDMSAAKKKKEKVEYMKSAAGPEPKAKKTKKAKKAKKKK